MNLLWWIATLEKFMTTRIVFALLSVLATGVLNAAPPPAKPFQGHECDDPALTADVRAGCKIWYNATAGNSRFYTYVLQQRFPVIPDWYGVLNSRDRKARFAKYGLINDPDCCRPGDPGCPRKSLDETYGFDFCPGDEQLLEYVGKSGYRDPACDAAVFPDPPDHGRPRQSPCDLDFGTSTGVMGFRKFPNPRFNAAKWKALNGSMASWGDAKSGLRKTLRPDPFHTKLRDASVEPPYLIGMSCGACHIAFDPLHPPRDPAAPRHENIRGAVGNQYGNVHAMIASGEANGSPMWQVFNYLRPGLIDTSAFPHDFLSNAGTPNAIFNLSKRPRTPRAAFTKWYAASSCAPGSDPETCWCQPGMKEKCWQRRQKKAEDPMDEADPVMNVLKGGEDNIGILEALHRVYINIGSCSETCWMNHLTNFFSLDPSQRNYGQTPFDIGQCRQDCPSFRAVEDRLPQLGAYLMSSRTPELYAARGLSSREELKKQLGADAVETGRKLFAENCAQCHSSQAPGPGGSYEAVDFHAIDSDQVRKDFLSNDQIFPVTQIGTNRSRALHGNHKIGRVWQQFASDDVHNRPQVQGIPEQISGGPGYFRPPSLLGMWATAPYLHNNAIGPEVCGKIDGKPTLYVSPYVDAAGNWLQGAPACRDLDPGVDGRFRLFQDSMMEMLTPSDQRLRKITLLGGPIRIETGVPLWDGDTRSFRPLTIEIPKGTPQAVVSNLQYKSLLDDLVLAAVNPRLFEQRVSSAEDRTELREMLRQFRTNISAPLPVIARHQALVYRRYMTSVDFLENGGHDFGSNLTDQQKKALIAFLATL